MEFGFTIEYCSWIFSDRLPQELRILREDNFEIWWKHSAWRYSNKCLTCAAGDAKSRVYVHDSMTKEMLYFLAESGKYPRNRSAWWCNQNITAKAPLRQSRFWNYSKRYPTTKTKAFRSRSNEVGKTRHHVEVSRKYATIYKGHCYQKHKQSGNAASNAANVTLTVPRRDKFLSRDVVNLHTTTFNILTRSLKHDKMLAIDFFPLFLQLKLHCVWRKTDWFPYSSIDSDASLCIARFSVILIELCRRGVNAKCSKPKWINFIII